MWTDSWSWSTRRNIHYFFLALNTCFLLFNLLFLFDIGLALISFMSCVITWTAILDIDMLIDLQNRIEQHKHNGQQLERNKRND